MISKSHRITNSSLALSKLNVQLTKAAHLQRQLIKKSWDLSMSHFIKHICLCHFTFALSEFLSVMLCCTVLCSFLGGVGFATTPSFHSWALPSVFGHNLEGISHLFSRFASLGWSQKGNLLWWSWS